MILMIFNHTFPHNSGFAARCKHEIEILSETNEVIVLCRKDPTIQEKEFMQVSSKKVRILRFSPFTKALERPDNGNYIAVLYELLRAVDLFINFSVALTSVLLKFSFQKKIRVYCVTSPLTVPFFTWLISLFFPVQRHVLEFHDLEPEMAQHIKHLPDTSVVMRVEYFLERFLCKQFTKIVVSSDTQKNRLQKRTGLPEARFFVLPNTAKKVEYSKYNKQQLLKKFHIGPGSFVVGYSSSLTFDYTTGGLEELFDSALESIKIIPELHFIIAGDGDGLEILKEKVSELHLENYVTFTGRIPDVYEIVAIAEVCIIPWKKNSFSESILPTKLLEYISFGAAIIAPSFGEFRSILNNGTTALLYSNTNELLQGLKQLHSQPELRRILAENTRTFYKKKYNEQNISKEFRDFLSLSQI